MARVCSANALLPAGGVLLCAVLTALPAHAQQNRARAADPPILPAVIGGMLGSAAGGLGGASLAYLAVNCDSGGSSGDVCETVSVTLGAAIGSIVGAAAGAHVFAQLGGGRPSFSRTLLASSAGLLVGVGAAALISGIDDEGVAVVISYSVAQGTIAGLAAALWQRKEE